MFLYAQNRSGVIAVAVTVEIVRIEIRVVPIVVVRCGIEQSRAGIVIGALSGRTDIVDAGVAGQIAVGLIAPGPLAFGFAAKSGGVAAAVPRNEPPPPPIGPMGAWGA